MLAIVVDRDALVVVDEQFGFGQVIGMEAMEIVAARAASYGIARSWLFATPAMLAGSAPGQRCF